MAFGGSIFTQRCHRLANKFDYLRAGLQSWNLLFNAVKLAPVGVVIGIGIRLTKEWVKIDIANLGRDVEANDLPHAFGAFKSQQHNNAIGMGLGLYIAQRILELHAGTLGVSSKHRRQGRGLRFGYPCGTLG